MRCDQCEYWNKDDPNDEGLENGKIEVRVCIRPLPFWNVTDWDESRESRILLPEYADRRFFAQDGSDYRAIVLTASDFFCADFKNKVAARE